MRDLCKSSAVVAAVVAVLEKQNNTASTTDRKQPTITGNGSGGGVFTRHNENKSAAASAPRSCTTTSAKFSEVSRGDSGTFETAVKDFHSVAEDVEKICSGHHRSRAARLEANSDSCGVQKIQLPASGGSVNQARGEAYQPPQVHQHPYQTKDSRLQGYSEVSRTHNKVSWEHFQSAENPKILSTETLQHGGIPKVSQKRLNGGSVTISCKEPINEIDSVHSRGPRLAPKPQNKTLSFQESGKYIDNAPSAEFYDKVVRRYQDRLKTENLRAQQGDGSPPEDHDSSSKQTHCPLNLSDADSRNTSGVQSSQYRPLRVNSIEEDPTGSTNTGEEGEEVTQDDGDDSTTPDPSSSDDSDVEREHVINEGLATIAEELSSLHSYTGGADGGEEGESSLEDEEDGGEENSTLVKEEGGEAGVSGWSNRESSTDLSDTDSSDSGSQVRDSSTRCNGDFRWISKQDQHSSPASMASMPSIEETGETTSSSKPLVSSSKPPIRPQKPAGHYQANSLGRAGSTPERTSGSLERSNGSLERFSAPSGTLERPNGSLGRSNTLDRPGGSLDRRRQHHQSRHDRDQRARSGSHVLQVPTTPPPRLDDYFTIGCQGWCNPHSVPQHDWCLCFQKRHERLDPQRYGSNPTLEHHRTSQAAQQQSRYQSDYKGSHPDIYGDFGHFPPRHHDVLPPCCPFHAPPPPCYYYDTPPRGGASGNYHCWSPPSYSKGGDQEEKFRKLQYEKDNLQLQVQVLTEQIEAQADKISDLEKILQEKKHHLSEAEEKLQKEMLSRSSLETQKLELMSIVSELKLQQAALERENLELRNNHQLYNNNADLRKPPLIPRMGSQPQLHSTPVHHGSNQHVNMMMSSPSPVAVGSSSSSRIAEHSSQEFSTSKSSSSIAYKRQIDIKYGSLPRQQFLTNGDGGGGAANADTTDSNANPSTVKKGVMFADTEKVMLEEVNSSSDMPGSPNISFNKNKGIKKIFGKMKRSGSGNLEDIPGIGEFQRGGVRATASARLGWNDAPPSARPDKPFVEWDTENICDWLQDLGLDSYVLEAKRWVQNGQQLLEAPISDIEKELNIKNPLHRKKLQLALIDMQVNGSSDPYLSQAGKLDTAWVLRWLDDTGLPQHKENFLINRVDGRVLHRLTMDDLALLHVTSMLHVTSIKRGIQVLRENSYDPGCLQRRSLPDDPPQPTPKQISLWTTHRVMEWLRCVDLAEYAPNLRGAGVHGGLMVLEPRFNAELLAALLNIPPGKTLLRRHLNTHFKELLGGEIVREKREAEATMGYVPLTPQTKLKISKKSQFSLKRKKSKGEADYGDLVCPLNPDKTGDVTASVNSCVGMMKTASLEAEGACLHPVDSSKQHHHLQQPIGTRSLPASVSNSPVPQRHV